MEHENADPEEKTMITKIDAVTTETGWSFSYNVPTKHEGELPAWCTDVSRLSATVESAAAHPSSRAAQRRRALVRGVSSSSDDASSSSKGSTNLQAWGCERVQRAVSYYREVRLQDFCRTELPDFTESLVVISFGARDGGFQLSQDIRRWMLSYMGLEESAIYHDYASLVGHPQSRVVVGDDGVTRQLNENWNIYFSNALAASPVMVFIVSEAWTRSAWCALEMRQRGELKVAKQAPGYDTGGGGGYAASAHSDPGDAAFEGLPDAAAAAYLDRHEAMSAQLEGIRAGWMSHEETFAEAAEAVFRAVAFGSKRNELYVFVDFEDEDDEAEAEAEAEAGAGGLRERERDAEGKDEGGSRPTRRRTRSSEAMRRIHAAVPEHQRFYHHTTAMSGAEKALELHALCVRVVEVVEEQAHVEAMANGGSAEPGGGGAELHRRFMEGVSISADGRTAAVELGGDGAVVAAAEAATGKSSAERRRGPCSTLRGLRALAAEDTRRREEEERAALDARLAKGRDDAIKRGLVFDTGPCPF